MKKIFKVLQTIALSLPVAWLMELLSQGCKGQVIGLAFKLKLVTLLIAAQRVWTSHGMDRPALGVLVCFALMAGILIYFDRMQAFWSEALLKARQRRLEARAAARS